MSTVSTFLTAILILVIVFILFKPGNQTPQIINALGSGSRQFTGYVTGQYAGSGYQ